MTTGKDIKATYAGDKNMLKPCMILAALAAFAPFASSATEDLVLTEDTTVNVDSGELTYGILGGTGFTLTKTGAGTLAFRCVTNATVAISIEEGCVEFAIEDASSVASSAWMHLDASDADSMTIVAEHGTNFVVRWDDSNRSGRYATNATVASGIRWMKPAEQRRPWLRDGYVNGLPVVDFGAFQVESLTNAASVTLGYGGAMDLSERSTAVAEAVIIARDTEDMLNARTVYSGLNAGHRGPPFVGDTATGNTYHFLRGDYTATYPYIVMNNPNAKAKDGLLYLDGVSVSPTQTIFPEGFHVLDFVPNEAVTVGALARDRQHSFGGKRMAEILLFTSSLSAADRASLYRYLVGKWFPAKVGSLSIASGATLALGEGVHMAVGSVMAESGAVLTGGGDLAISGESSAMLSFPSGATLAVESSAYLQGASWGGTLAKSGDGVLTVAELGAAESMSVLGGTLKVDALADRKSWFHADASDASWRTTEVNGAVTNVTRLSDVGGKSRYAAATTQELTWLRPASSRKPMLRHAWQNGLDIVDFGMQQVSSLLDGDSQPIGYGAAMDWSETSSSMRDVFVVAGRHESTLTLASTYTQIGNNTSAAPFVGAKGTYHFLGGAIPTSGTSWPYLLYPNPNAYAHKGAITIDGTAIATNVNGYLAQEYPGGMHVVNFIPDVNLEGATFARDRNNSFGGVLLGEAIVFTNRLSETMRGRIRRGLQVKWLASSDYPEYVLSNVTVASGAALSMPYARLSVNGALSPAGSLSVGALCLADGAVVVLDSENPEALVGTEVPVAECRTVDFDAAKVAVKGTLAEKTKVRLVKRAGGLYAKVSPKYVGMMLIYR